MFNQCGSIVKRVAARVRHREALLFHHLFTSSTDAALYRELISTPDAHRDQSPVTLHPLCLGGKAVLCRPGTRDKSSLEDLLVHHCYLPPAELHHPKVIVDLGANVGYTIAHFAHLYPRARIFGVELDRDNFELARQNTQCCEGVTLINAALWSSDGHITYGGPGEDAYHVIAPVTKQPDVPIQSGDRAAPSITMQSLLAKYNISRIDYLKMDIEGAEAEIILNADCSWLDRVDALKIELHHVAYRDFREVLTAQGFRCRKDTRHWSCIVATRA
jgi:FkbM family methyltransferase